MQENILNIGTGVSLVRLVQAEVISNAFSFHCDDVRC